MAEVVATKVPKWSYPTPVNGGLEITRLLSKNKDLYLSDSFSPKICDNAHKDLCDTLKSIDRNTFLSHMMIVKAATQYLDKLELLKEFVSKKCQNGITFTFLSTVDSKNTFSWNSSKSLRPIEAHRDRAMIKKKLVTNSSITPTIVEMIPIRDEFMLSIEYEACFALCCMILGYMNLAEIRRQAEREKPMYNIPMGCYRNALILCQSAIGWAERFQELNYSEQTETKPVTYIGLQAYCYAKFQDIMTEREFKRIDLPTRLANYVFISDQMTIAYQCLNATKNPCCAPGVAVFALYYRFLYLAMAHLEYAKMVADGLIVPITKNGVTTLEKQMQDTIDYGKAHNVALAGLYFLDLADNVAERCDLKQFKDAVATQRVVMEELKEKYFNAKESMGKAFFRKYIYATPSQIGASPFMFLPSLGPGKETISLQIDRGKQDLFVTELDLNTYLKTGVQ